MIVTPIAIHSFFVFVRLYWFEKHFQHIVREARNYRRTRSRSKTEGKESRDIDQAERGVNGRDIVVLHAQSAMLTNGFADRAGAANVPLDLVQNPAPLTTPEKAGVLEDAERQMGPQSPTESLGSKFHRDITFTDEINREILRDPSTRLPVSLSTEQHIQFLENQRNPKDRGTLRIPGPRDFDRGLMPVTLMEDEGDEGLMKNIICATDPSVQREDHEGLHKINGATSSFNADNHPVSYNVKTDEQTSPCTKAKTSAFGNLKLRNTRHRTTPSSGIAISAARSRATTFATARTSQSRDPMPYLSWTPTIKRNSAFIDLTEEQREELGGIEYRALKTLAFILVGKGQGCLSSYSLYAYSGW